MSGRLAEIKRRYSARWGRLCLPAITRSRLQRTRAIGSTGSRRTPGVSPRASGLSRWCPAHAGTKPGPDDLVRLEPKVASLLQAGFSRPEALMALLALSQFTIGCVMKEQSRESNATIPLRAPDVLEDVKGTEATTINVEQILTVSAEETLEFGLSLILARLRSRNEANTVSSPHSCFLQIRRRGARNVSRRFSLDTCAISNRRYLLKRWVQLTYLFRQTPSKGFVQSLRPLNDLLTLLRSSRVRVSSGSANLFGLRKRRVDAR